MQAPTDAAAGADEALCAPGGCASILASVIWGLPSTALNETVAEVGTVVQESAIAPGTPGPAPPAADIVFPPHAEPASSDGADGRLWDADPQLSNTATTDADAK